MKTTLSLSSPVLIVALLLSIPFLYTSCEKPPDPIPPPTPAPCDTCLPAITTEGKRTFGCRINGKVWLPKSGGFTLSYFNNKINISAVKPLSAPQERERIHFDIRPINDTGYFKFPNSDLSLATFTYSPSIERINDYVVDIATKGYLHITRFDYEGGVISGTFEFDAYNSQGDTVHVTDGRFDLYFH
jgi:hypothetical protein